MKTLTLKQAKELKPGDHLIDLINKNADGIPAKWKVIGKPKTWKRNPERVQISIKRGLYQYDKFTEQNLHEFSLCGENPQKK